MGEITFFLSAEDIERLFAIKEIQGRDDMTGNRFARELLEERLRELVPAVPEIDADGRILNREAYKGGIQ